MVRFSLRTILIVTGMIALMCCLLRMSNPLAATFVCTGTLLISIAAFVGRVRLRGNRYGLAIGIWVYLIAVFGPFSSDFRDSIAPAKSLEALYDHYFFEGTEPEVSLSSIEFPRIADERRICFVLIGQCYSAIIVGVISACLEESAIRSSANK